MTEHYRFRDTHTCDPDLCMYIWILKTERRQTKTETNRYTPSSPANGDTPAHALGLSRGLSHGDGLSHDCALCNSPRDGLGCETYGDASHESDCGPSPWTVPACWRSESIEENMKPRPQINWHCIKLFFHLNDFAVHQIHLHHENIRNANSDFVIHQIILHAWNCCNTFKCKYTNFGCIIFALHQFSHAWKSLQYKLNDLIHAKHNLVQCKIDPKIMNSTLFNT